LVEQVASGICIGVGDTFADGLPRRFNGLKGLDLEGRVGGDVDNSLPKPMEPEEEFDSTGRVKLTRCRLALPSGHSNPSAPHA
jgi:hypothetical protein